MQNITLQVNGKPLVFTGTSVSYAGHELLYSKMSNIAHRGGDKPAFLFHYEEKRLALPYDPQDKDTVMKIFKQIALLEKRRKEQESALSSDKEEPALSAEKSAGSSVFDTPPEHTISQPVPQQIPADVAPAPPVNKWPEAEQQVAQNMKRKGFWSTGRLVIGIISMVLFLFITLQSCAAGLSNTLMENNATSGSAGLFTAIMFLAGGIVGLCTRNARRIVGPVIAAVLYLIGASFTLGTGDTYGDLPLWGAIAAVFGLIFLFCAIKTKLNRQQPFYKPLWLILIIAIAAIIALVAGFSGFSNSSDTKSDTGQQQSATVEKINMDNAEGSLIYKKIEQLKDYDGKPAVAVYFDYTNRKDEPYTAPETFYIQVFQDGVECEMGFVENENAATDNASKEIQKGKTLEIAFVYTLQDTEKPITLKVSDQSEENLFNDIYQEQKIALK